MFRGSMVALVTPIKHDNSIDYDSFKSLIDWHLESGTNGIVVAGTTGESPTLTTSEWQGLIEIALERVQGKIPVIAGTGTNCTLRTIDATRHAMELGVDACLLITPYYNRPTQEGLYQHFRAVSDAVPIPIILYNNPIRTACDMLPSTVKRLQDSANIVAIKEAKSAERYQELVKLCGDNLTILSGDDSTGIACFAAGGRGIISVTANVVPGKMAALCKAALAGNMAEASEIDKSLQPLHSALFVEPNPIPVKWALHHMKKIPAGIRLPLTPLSEKQQSHLHNVLATMGI